MFKVGQKVLSTESNDEFEAGVPGVVTFIDNNSENVPYYVNFTDTDGEPYEIWCCPDEIEADGEVIE
jgi:hypothetical protein